jgi:hypothetical protein
VVFLHTVSSACLAHSSTLKMEPIHSSETLADLHLTTQSYIPEDTSLQTTTGRTSNPTKL